MAVSSITVRELAALCTPDGGVDILDVRTPAEYAAVHAVGARLVPLHALTPQAASAGRRAPADPLYVICKSGHRSLQACQRLAAAGLEVVNVVGGTDAWVAAGLPVERPAGVSAAPAGGALRRGPFRLAALLLIPAGLLAGVYVHPGFAALAFAGWLGLMLTGGCCGGACALPRPPQSPPNQA